MKDSYHYGLYKVVRYKINIFFSKISERLICFAITEDLLKNPNTVAKNVSSRHPV